MNIGFKIAEPFVFNPLKHHLEFIREFIYLRTEGNSNSDIRILIKELKHIGTSVMDVYTGSLSVEQICKEIKDYLIKNNLLEIEKFSLWTGRNSNEFRIISLSDSSGWTLKYHDDNLRFIHLFPARSSIHSFRVKSNTLKSALIYFAMIGKDYITGEDLNRARSLLDLSPVKNSAETAAITEMIEILRMN